MQEFQSFEQKVGTWCEDCFEPTTALDINERNWRFLEEALELVQSLGGSAGDAHLLVDYVFNRPRGDAHQEVGGVMVTLAALTFAARLDLAGSAENELRRITEPIMMERIRAKHASKPDRSPLPGDFKHSKKQEP